MNKIGKLIWKKEEQIKTTEIFKKNIVMRKKITYTVFCLVMGQICFFDQTIKISNGLSVFSVRRSV